MYYPEAGAGFLGNGSGRIMNNSQIGLKGGRDIILMETKQGWPVVFC
jgi:hypothetical protein